MRCVNCGLLAMRKKSDASLAEVPGYIREKDPTTRTAVVNKFEDEHEITPVCLARQATFSPKKEEYSEQFKEERECPGFTEWRQGFTPKEHSEFSEQGRRDISQRRRTLKTSILSVFMGVCLRPIIETRIGSLDDLPAILIPAVLFGVCFYVLITSKD